MELPVPGATDPGVFYLRSRNDARRLRDAASSAETVVVIGSGFIGCEAAASLARRGLSVTLATIEDLPQAARLGEAAGRRIQSWLEDDGVALRLGVEVEAIEGGRRVRLGGGSQIEGDVVLVAGGVGPNASMAQEAGLAVHGGRVVVDAQMRATRPGVLAAGDVAFAFNTTAGRPISVEHWGEAETMGRIAGETAAGRDASWSDVPGFWSTIGAHTLKYTAWGDGFDQSRFVDHGEGSFTVWYGRNGVVVGVLTHEADDDLEPGEKSIAEQRPFVSDA